MCIISSKKVHTTNKRKGWYICEEINYFYYPISPNIAIKLCVTSKGSKYGKAKNICLDMTDENEVKKLNLAIAKNCYKEVFSNDENVLKSIRSELQS